tara:strand:- start:6393 stop:7655 length:1263 start_codon:yes stop_codon:yes gene_type:complete
MNVAILGSGGREHAICQKISESKKIKKIYCIPGNAGTSELAQNVNIELSNLKLLLKFLKDNLINLVVIGPEKPLVDGLADFLKLNNIKVFGPNKKVSRLEGSKIFTKNLCQKYKIPTAKFGVFKNRKKSFQFIKSAKFPIVVKADNLASGKGVYICNNINHYKKAIDEIFNGKFGKAKKVLVEEFLKGEEMSYFIISDGKTYKKFLTAQDHKRIFENDKGPNTGGMGAYTPSGLINKKLDKKILQKIILPTLKAVKDMKTKYIGFLYAGLMIVNKEPYLIEYNVRMGDPECQTILPLLKTDLLRIINNTCNQNLKKTKIEWFKKKSICIVLSSKGYPKNFKKNILIKNLGNLKIKKNSYVFHAGTKMINNKFYSVGGRVLNFVSISSNLKKARKISIDLIKKLNWKNGFFRKDIGHKIIN